MAQKLIIPPNAIEKWVQKHFDYKKRTGKEGPELVIANPFYGNDKKKFNISLSKAVCHDWRSDDWAPVNSKTGERNCSFIKFVQLYNKCSFNEAVLDILGNAGKAFLYVGAQDQTDAEELKENTSVVLPGGVRSIVGSKDLQADLLIKWLKSRGYTEEEIDKYKLHYAGMDVYWIYYEYDEFVYWQSRSRLNKRFNYPSSNRDYLYGFDYVEPAKYLMITESIFDKHVLGDQTMASGGAVLSDNQIKKIKVIGPKEGIILSPDNDKAGIKSVVENAKLLIPLSYKIFYSIPPKNYNGVNIKDWNDLFVKCKLSCDQIREIHYNNIKEYNIQNSIKLRRNQI